jgi:ferredoxin
VADVSEIFLGKLLKQASLTLPLLLIRIDRLFLLRSKYRCRKMKILVDRDRCRGSGECVKVCPREAISLVDGTAMVDDAKCDFDGMCIPVCPHGAISFSEEEVE